MMRQLLLDIRPIASPSLNNFIAGANRELLNHLRGMAADHSATATYLWGESGSGRTHLLRALAAQARARGLYLDAEQINNTPADTLIAALEATHAKLWLFDDVHLLEPMAQIGLFRAINLAAARGMKVDAEVFDYLLRHGRRDIRSLLGILDLLDEHSLTRQRPVTLPLLREIMQARLI